jgi:serine/threonine protein kinase
MVEGLEYLHNNGLKHCDLKPENVLVRLDGFYISPVIADFGISVAMGN